MVRLRWQVLLFTASLAALALAGLASSRDADADERVVQVEIDVDVTGNGDNVLGPTENCNATPLQIGETIEVDVVVRGVPTHAPNEYPSGIGGFEFDFLFDPAVVQVNEVQIPNGPSIVKAEGSFAPFVYLDYSGPSRPLTARLGLAVVW